MPHSNAIIVPEVPITSVWPTSHWILGLFLRNKPSDPFEVPTTFPPFTPNADLYLLKSCVPLISRCVQRKTSLVAQMVKHLSTMRETRVWSLGREDPLEKEMATHSSILAWKIPWMKEPGPLQSMRLQRVGHDWANACSLSWLSKCGKALLHHFLFIPRKWNLNWLWVNINTHFIGHVLRLCS